MEAKNIMSYNFIDGADRIDEILNAERSNFSNEENIPSRSSLTYTNGYYVNVTAMFVDIVGSSDMTESHKRPTLAKIYRSFISECVAIMNSESICKEINIYGDCVWGVFDTLLDLDEDDIDKVFYIAYTINGMINILNYKLKKKGYSTISIGIGIDYGLALMVKAGYSGSSINDVIWMGDVVNSASNICSIAGRNGRETIIVSNFIYKNLKKRNQGLLRPYYDSELSGRYYEGNIVNTSTKKWYKENCK